MCNKKTSRIDLACSLVAVALALGGCGSSGGGGGVFTLFDISVAPTDMPPHADLTVDMTTISFPGVSAGFVVNGLKMPMMKADYSIDLDGDGKVDNAFSQIVAVLSAQGLALQAGVDAAISTGQQVSIVEIGSSDPTLQSDPGAGVTFENGKPMANPDFSGKGTFSVDNSAAPSQFTGGLNGGSFTSPDPVTTKNPVHLGLRLALVQGAPPVILPLNGAHISFRVGPSGQGGLMSGQLQGSIKATDLQSAVIPAVAAFLTAKLQNPNDPSAPGIRQLFDTGGCTNPNGTMAVRGDNKIDICELAGNLTIMALLSPDLQIFNPPGSNNYAPVPRNQVVDPKNRDSLSIGIGFTAVQATINH
jgi:hypothetical protein